MPRIPRSAAPERDEVSRRYQDAPIEVLRRACSCSPARSSAGNERSPSLTAENRMVTAQLARIERILDRVLRNLAPFVGAAR